MDDKNVSKPQAAAQLRRTLLALGIAALSSHALPGFAQTNEPAANAKDDSDVTAQDKPKSQAANNVEEVVVTGQRASVESAIDIKRNAEQIVDSISAVDIGALPDRSVTESLQRISGVTIDRMFDANNPNRFSVEGSGVLIRGMTQVRSELNGRDSFTAANTRGLSFEDVPSELMAGVDVYKNPSADMIEGGIGGTVNLRTRLPFDTDKRLISASASANYGDFVEEVTPSASILYSDRWSTDHGEFGALIDLAYSRLKTRTDSIQMGRPFRRQASDFGLATTADCQTNAADCVYVPAGGRWSELDFDRERTGIAVALQWRPNERLDLTAQYLRSNYQMDWTEYSGWFQGYAYDIMPADGSVSFDDTGLLSSGNLLDGSYTPEYDENGVATGNWVQAGVPFGSTTRYARQEQTTSDYSLGLKFYVDDRWTVTSDLQYVDATANSLDFTVNTEVRTESLGLDISGSKPEITLPAETLADPANYYWAAAMDERQANTGSELAWRMDTDFKFDDSLIKSLRGGVRYTHRKADNKDTGYNWGALSEWWQGNSYTGSWPGNLGLISQHLSGYTTFHDFSNFYRGKVNLPGGMWAATDGLVHDLQNNADLLLCPSTGPTADCAEVNGNGWSPTSYEIADINKQKEDTYSAYGLLRFEAPTQPVDGNVGVRVVSTRGTASGYVQQPDLTGYTLLDPDVVAAIGTGDYFPVDFKNDYTDVLPSLNLRIRFTPELQWRLAASRAISRPTFDQIRGYIQLAANVEEETDASNIPTSQTITKYTGTGGNPDLKPMRADQFDSALEWYFAPAGNVYTTLFYKDISDYFVSGTTTENLFGQDWVVTSTQNGDKGTMKGFEFGYSQFYDFLPGALSGIGLQANFTYVKSNGTPGSLAAAAHTPGELPLEGLSKTSYNLVFMYEKYGWSGRLAYNWRERWLLTSNDIDADTGPVWNDDFGQLDGSLFYRFNEHLQVGIEANNLTNATQKLLQGPYLYGGDTTDAAAFNDGYVDPRLYDRGWFTFDRRFAFTVRATF